MSSKTASTAGDRAPDPAVRVTVPPQRAILEQERAEHVSTTLSDREVLITGGISGFQELCCRPKPVIVLLSSAEVYSKAQL